MSTRKEERIKEILDKLETNPGVCYTFRDNRINMVNGGSTQISCLDPEFDEWSDYSSGPGWCDQEESIRSRSTLERGLLKVRLSYLLEDNFSE